LEAGPSGQLEVAFEVREPWMTGSGDDCVITATSLLDEWGPAPRTFGVAGADLAVPGTGQLRAESRPHEVMHFKVRYPALGRYRARLDLSASTLSVAEDAALPRGEVAWSARGVLSKDARGRVYVVASGGGDVARLNPEDGTALWTAAPGASSYPACALDDHLIWATRDGLVSLDPETGNIRWRREVAATSLFCDPAGERLYASDDTTLTAVSVVSGASLWTITPRGVDPRPVAVTSDQVVLTRSLVNDTTATAFSAVTGKAVWGSSTGGGAFFTADANGRIYVSGQSYVARVSKANGGYLWRRDTRTSYAQLSAQGDTGFLRDGSRFSALDLETGDERWFYGLYAGATEIPHVMPDGGVYVSGSIGRTVAVFPVDPASGGPRRWILFYDSSLTRVAAGPGGSLLLLGSDYAARYARPSGALEWRTEVPSGSLVDLDPRGVYVMDLPEPHWGMSHRVSALDPASGA
jgi:outer membrane protein assembly factor BamB